MEDKTPPTPSLFITPQRISESQRHHKYSHYHHTPFSHHASLLTVSDRWSGPCCRRPQPLRHSPGPGPRQADRGRAVQDRVHHRVGHRVRGEGDPGVRHQVRSRVQDCVRETMPANNKTSGELGRLYQ